MTTLLLGLLTESWDFCFWCCRQVLQRIYPLQFLLCCWRLPPLELLLLVLDIACVFPPWEQTELHTAQWKLLTGVKAPLEMAAVVLLDFDVVVVLVGSWGLQWLVKEMP